MRELDLSPDDWGHLAAAVRWLRLSHCAPDYLQAFLAERLRQAGKAALAAKVESFTPGQMDALCAKLVQEQE